MFFEVSPGLPKKETKQESITDNEEELLSLAPFSKKPKLFFENILVGASVCRKLIIENPTDDNVILRVNSNIPEELNFHLSWQTKTVPNHSKEILELFWKPVVVTSCRYSITLENGRRIHKDVPIVFKSIATTKIKKTQLKKQPTYRTSPPIKSLRKKPSAKKVKSTTFCHHEKENIFKSNEVPSEMSFNFRETYTVNEIKQLIKFQSPPAIKEKLKSLNFSSSIEENNSSKPPFWSPDNIKDVTADLSLASYALSQGYNNQLTERNIFVDCKFSPSFNMTSPLREQNRTFEFKQKLNGTWDLNLSSGTYVKDLSVNISPPPRTSSPLQETYGFRSTFDTISEENLETTFQSAMKQTEQSFRKRKSTTSMKISPPKKPFLATKRRHDWSVMSGRHVRSPKLTETIKEKSLSVTRTDFNTIVVQDPFILAATCTIDPFMSGYFDSNWMSQQEIYFKKWLNSLLTPPAELTASVDDKPVDVAQVWQECKNREVAPAPTKEMISNSYHTNYKLNSLRRAAQNLYHQPEIVLVLSKVCQAIENDRLSMRQDKEFHLNVSLKAVLTKLIFSYNPLWLRIGLETIYNQTIPLTSNSDIPGLTTFIMDRLFKDPHLFRKYKTVYAPKYVIELKKFFLKKFLSLVYFLDQAKNRRLILHDPCLFCKNSEIKESRDILIRLSQEVLAAMGDITKYLRMFGYVVSHKQMFIHEFNYAVNNLGVDLRDGVRLVRVMEIILLEDGLTNKLRVPALSRLQKVHNMKIVFEALEKVGYRIQCEIVPKDVVEGHKEKTLSFLWQIIYKFQAPLMIQKATTIQMWFRSLPVVLKRRRLERERTRREMAAVKIQSFYRMIIQRRIFKIKYQTLTSLQSYAKGWLIRNNYLKRIKAVVVLQKNARMFLTRKRYLRLLQATKLLKTNAAIVIQQWYKSKKETLSARQEFQQIKSITIFIQKKWRANKLCKEHREQYEKLKRSVLLVQRRFRGQKLMIQQREQFVQLQKATIKIQSWFKAVTQKNKYNKLKIAAVCIQDKYRAILLCRKERANFLKLKESVVVTQRLFRSQLERRRYLLLRSSTITIQTYFRALIQMKNDRRRYLELKTQTIYIQNKWRANKLCEKQKEKYKVLRSTTVTIQRKFRAQKLMIHQRKLFLMLRQATVKIQSWFRCLKQQNKYNELKMASICIQRKYRAILVGRKVRTDFLKLKDAVLVIQRRFRAQNAMLLERNNYLLLRSSIITIQTHFRALLKMRNDRRHYVELRKQTIFIQNKWRANKLCKEFRDRYVQLKSGTLVIQRRFKAQKLMIQQRNQFLQLQQATIKIQSYFRCKTQKSKYNQLKIAAVCIQVKYRAILLSRKERANFLKLKESVVVLQRQFRAQKAMRLNRHNYLLLRSSSIIIQTHFRALMKMRNDRMCYLELRERTIFIQTKWRANKLCKEQTRRFKNLKSATRVIQCRFRAQKLMVQQSKQFVELREATIKIQSWFRGVTQKNKFNELKTVSICIQRKYRANLLYRKDRANFLQLKEAALKIQRRYRAQTAMRLERSRYLLLRSSAITIQTHFKALIQMRNVRAYYLKLKTQTIFVQSKWRLNKLCKDQRRKYTEIKSAAEVIQRRFRANKLMVQQRGKFTQFRQATIRIQSWFRGITQKNKYNEFKTAVIYIQRKYHAIVLRRKERANFLKLKKSVLVVQRRFRAQTTMRFERKNYLVLRSSVVTIQAHFKALLQMRIDRTYFLKLKKQTMFVQNKFRANQLCKKQRIYYQMLRKITITVQRRFRANQLMMLERNYYQSLHSSTIVIQQWYQSIIAMRKERTLYLAKKHAVLVIESRYLAQKQMQIDWNNYKKLRRATIFIQFKYRAVTLLKKDRNTFLKTRNVAVLIQTYARGFLVRRKYKEYFTPEAREQRRVMQERNAAAIKIQSYWKGYQRRCTHTLELQRICLRAKQANSLAASKDNLGKRSEQAVSILASDATIIQITRALEDLEYATRRSATICGNTALYIPKQMYLMLSATNRSLPEVKICILATKILINFCKYPVTKQYSFVPEYIDSLFTLMLRCCDKDDVFFPALCTLIWLFAHNKKWKMFILKLPNIHQRLLKIDQLCKRKEAMVQRSKPKSTSVFGVPIKNIHMPTLVPDWGLEYEHKPNMFLNSVHAINCVLDILKN